MDHRALLFLPDGRKLIVATEALSVWDAQAGGKLQQLPVSGGHLSSLALSPDGRLLAGAAPATGGRLLLWKVK